MTPEQDLRAAVRSLERRVEALDRLLRLQRVDAAVAAQRGEQWLAVVDETPATPSSAYAVTLYQLCFDTSGGLVPHTPTESKRSRGARVLARAWPIRSYAAGDEVVVERLPGRLSGDAYDGEWIIGGVPYETRYAFMTDGLPGGYVVPTTPTWSYELSYVSPDLSGNPIANGTPFGNVGRSFNQRLAVSEGGTYLVAGQATVFLALESGGGGGGYVDRSVALTLRVARSAGAETLTGASLAATAGVSVEHTTTVVGRLELIRDEVVTFTLGGVSYVAPAAGNLVVERWHFHLLKVP